MSSAVNRSRTSGGTSKPVAFRFKSRQERAAFERLASQHGTTAGRLAGELARAALESNPESAVAPHLADEIADLRRALAEALLVLFIKSAGVSQVDAVKWFTKHWPPERNAGVP